jgi:hypothetical protein
VITQDWLKKMFFVDKGVVFWTEEFYLKAHIDKSDNLPRGIYAKNNRFGVRGKNSKHLGYYATFAEASAVYMQYVNELMSDEKNWVKVGSYLKNKDLFVVRIGDNFYGLNRLMWIYWHGVEPDGFVYFKDVRNDFSKNNLGIRTKSEEQLSADRKIGKTGEKGITIKRGRFVVQATSKEGKSVHCGAYSSLKDAIERRNSVYTALGRSW